MNNLIEYSISEIATITDCEHKTAPVVDESNYYSVRTTNISNGKIDFDNCNRVSEGTYNLWTQRMVPQEGDIVLAREAPVGEVGYVEANRKICLGQRTVLIRPNQSLIHNRFLLYYLMNKEVKNGLINKSSGSVVEHLNVRDIREFKIKIPKEIIIQKRIAGVLSSLDDKIDLLHRQNKTLEQIAETLFRQWFVEAAEEGWEKLSSLENWVLFDPREKLDKTIEYQVFDMKCLSNTDMTIGEGVVREVSSATTFRNNDTLLAKITPCLENGKTGFVMNLMENEIAKGSTEFIVIRSMGQVSPYWVYCLARSQEFRNSAIQSMTGTSGRQRVQIQMLRNYQVSVDLNLMAKFHNFVEPNFQKIKSNVAQIQTLTQLRDALLPKLMAGEVRVNIHLSC
ncbi:MAG: type I restriction-modification system subunit S [Ignavibacteriales bacterium]